VPWTKPQDVELRAGEPFPRLGGLVEVGFQAAMCDGSGRSFVKDIYDDEATLRALAGYRDGVLFRFATYAKSFHELPEFRPQIEPHMAGAVKSVGSAAWRARSQSNLKGLALAMRSHHNRYGVFPPPAICDKTGTPLLSWRVQLLPYLEENSLYKAFRLDEPWDSEHNKNLLQYMPEAFASPTDPTSTDTFYQVPVGTGTAFDLKRRRGSNLRDIRDGAKNTLMILEAGEAVPWTRPIDFDASPGAPLAPLGGIFPEGFHACTFSGSVYLITSDAVRGESDLRALLGIADGTPFDMQRLNHAR
jgi:hypothetical protein